ncbi:P1 family peptidase [Yinghuangia sp. ASG 101]|uniref:P1 family peptidase n=1 Tax=Yinghuangia sp. ASG 101 TaxID=2896848 RepID=UPI001E38F6E5|nr:P1 family peptidase [Yinghuangia sp. ASG 101]UGQ09313.1 P1 family peptidase [Yinghuangia sp. ASG 101]
MTTPPVPRPGPRNALTDVDGLRVGHASLVGDGALTGVTVVLGPPGGFVAAVEVRGGGPGTRETDALDPGNLVPRVEAIALTGGSAYGLDAAAGVVAWLEDQGRGFPVGAAPHEVVPVVPAATIFDLGRGGDFRRRPDAALGRAATEAAAGSDARAQVATGGVGAGAGARVGGLKGGVGTASCLLDGGVTVAALAVVNAAGSAVDPIGGLPYAIRLGLPGEFPLSPPTHDEHAAALKRFAAGQEPPPLNTTLAVVATDAALTRAQARRTAAVAHDGFARALRPVHTLYDGDTVFAISTGAKPLPSVSPDTPYGVDAEAAALAAVHAAAADVVARAIVDAVLAADTVETDGATLPSYRSLYPVATSGWRPRG